MLIKVCARAGRPRTVDPCVRAVLAGEKALRQPVVRKTGQAFAGGQIAQLAFVVAPVHEVVVRLKGDVSGQPLARGYGERFGQPRRRVVRRRDITDFSFPQDGVERVQRFCERRVRVVRMCVVHVDAIDLQAPQRGLGCRPDSCGREPLEPRRHADLRGDHHVVAGAACRHPAADDRLRFTAGMAGHPRRIHVRGVDEVATRRRVRVEHIERLLLVCGPAEDVAAETQREDVEVSVRDSCHLNVPSEYTPTFPTDAYVRLTACKTKRRLNAEVAEHAEKNATTKTRKHEKYVGFLRVFVFSWLPSTTSRTSPRPPRSLR